MHRLDFDSFDFDRLAASPKKKTLGWPLFIWNLSNSFLSISCPCGPWLHHISLMAPFGIPCCWWIIPKSDGELSAPFTAAIILVKVPDRATYFQRSHRRLNMIENDWNMNIPQMLPWSNSQSYIISPLDFWLYAPCSTPNHAKHQGVPPPLPLLPTKLTVLHLGTGISYGSTIDLCGFVRWGSWYSHFWGTEIMWEKWPPTDQKNPGEQKTRLPPWPFFAKPHWSPKKKTKVPEENNP